MRKMNLLETRWRPLAGRELWGTEKLFLEQRRPVAALVRRSNLGQPPASGDRTVALQEATTVAALIKAVGA